MKKHILMLLAITAITTAVLTGCGQKEASKAGSQGKIIAEINGEKISEQDFQKYSMSHAGANMLMSMLEDRMTLDLAKEKDVSPTDSQIEKRIDIIRKTSDLEGDMKRQGISLDDVKDQLRVIVARENIALELAGDKIKDEDVKGSYETDKESKYQLPERVRMEFAVFKDQKSADAAVAKTKEGKDMDTACTDADGPVYSLVVSKNDKGMTPELKKATFDAPVGETQVIKVPTGAANSFSWLVVKPIERMKAVTVSFEEAKDHVRGQLALGMAMQDPDIQKELREARRSAGVKVLDPKLKEVEKTFIRR